MIEVLENHSKKFDIFRQMTAEIMGMPPQVIESVLIGSLGHFRFDSLKTQGFEGAQRWTIRSQKPVGRYIHGQVWWIRLFYFSVSSWKREVGIDQTCAASQ